MSIFRSFSIFVLLNILSIGIINAQIPDEYISNYSLNYSDNIPINLKISPNGLSYAYIYNQNTIKLHTKANKYNIIGSKILTIENDNIVYIKENKIFKYYFTNEGLSTVLLGKISHFSLYNQKNLILLDNKNLLIASNNNIKKYKGIQSVDKINIGEEPAVILKGKEYNILIYKNEDYEIKDTILYIINGTNDILAISPKYIYTIFKKYKEIKRESSNISKKIDSLIEEGYQTIFKNKNYIYVSKYEDAKKNNNYFVSDKILDLNFFYTLSNNTQKKAIEILKRLELKSGVMYNYDSIERSSEIPLLNTLTNSSLISPLIIFEKNINIENSNIKRKQKIRNILYNRSIEIDILVPNYQSYEITKDLKYMYILDLNNSLWQYNFMKNKLKQVANTVFFHEFDLQIRNNINYINIFHYDSHSEKIYLNTSKQPLIIDSLGKVDTIVINPKEQNKYNKTILYKIISEDKFLAYSINEQNDSSTIYYLNKRDVIAISTNQNYKVPRVYIYGPNTYQERGYFEVTQDIIFWSESNLNYGTYIYTYNIAKKTKDTLNILFEKKYDSLEYKYFSYEINNQLIKGGIKFPKNYQKNKKYPIILSIYMNKLESLHFPSNTMNMDISNTTSNAMLNELNLLHQGYAIGYIDIPFSDGIYSSHSYYVNEIIKNVFPSIPNIDNSNIGILGHSRTGGQVFGVLTNDTLVKCAIISNGVLSELLDVSQFSDYSVDNKRSSRFLRKSTYSFFSKYNIFEDIINNYSTVYQKDPYLSINKINSTILFFLNDNDASISSNNGYFAYIKSKLLNKNTYMLNFINEGHNLIDNENRKKAYEILINYLNFYLKEGNSKNDYWTYK